MLFLCNTFCIFDNRKIQIAIRWKSNPLDTVHYSNSLWNLTHIKRTRNRFHFLQNFGPIFELEISKCSKISKISKYRHGQKMKIEENWAGFKSIWISTSGEDFKNFLDFTNAQQAILIYVKVKNLKFKFFSSIKNFEITLGFWYRVTSTAHDLDHLRPRRTAYSTNRSRVRECPRSPDNFFALKTVHRKIVIWISAWVYEIGKSGRICMDISCDQFKSGGWFWG